MTFLRLRLASGGEERSDKQKVVSHTSRWFVQLLAPVLVNSYLYLSCLLKLGRVLLMESASISKAGDWRALLQLKVGVVGGAPGKGKSCVRDP